MVNFRKKKKVEKQSLLTPQKSGLFGKKTPRSEDFDNGEKSGTKRLTNTFKNKTVYYYDERTPPSTPDPQSPLNVTVLTTRKSPPSSPARNDDEDDDNSTSESTISDLSASVVRMPTYSPPVNVSDVKLPFFQTRGESSNAQPAANATTSDLDQGSTTPPASGPSCEACTPDMMSDFLGLVDNACTPFQSNKANTPPDKSDTATVLPDYPLIRHAWGIAPSDDDESVLEEIKPPEAKEPDNTTTTTTGNVVAQENTDKITEKTSHDNFELVLDDDVTDIYLSNKRFGWMRKRDKDPVHEAQHGAVLGAEPEGSDSKEIVKQDEMVEKEEGPEGTTNKEVSEGDIEVKIDERDIKTAKRPSFKKKKKRSEMFKKTTLDVIIETTTLEVAMKQALHGETNLKESKQVAVMNNEKQEEGAKQVEVVTAAKSEDVVKQMQQEGGGKQTQLEVALKLASQEFPGKETTQDEAAKEMKQEQKQGETKKEMELDEAVDETKIGGSVQEAIQEKPMLEERETVQESKQEDAVQEIKKEGADQGIKKQGDVQDMKKGDDVQDMKKGDAVQDMKKGDDVQDMNEENAVPEINYEDGAQEVEQEVTMAEMKNEVAETRAKRGVAKQRMTFAFLAKMTTILIKGSEKTKTRKMQRQAKKEQTAAQPRMIDTLNIEDLIGEDVLDEDLNDTKKSIDDVQVTTTSTDDVRGVMISPNDVASRRKSIEEVMGTDISTDDVRSTKKSTEVAIRANQPRMINLADEVLNPDELLGEEVHDEDVEEKKGMTEVASKKGLAEVASKMSVEMAVLRRSISTSDEFSSADLLGEEVFEEYEQENNTLKEESKKARADQVLLDIKRVTEIPLTKDPRTRTWSLSRTLSIGKFSATEDKPVQEKPAFRSDIASCFGRMHSSPMRLLNRSFVSRKPTKPIKPVWKSVVDANTGRIYYYHRFTRQTTWTKPDGFDDLQKPKQFGATRPRSTRNVNEATEKTNEERKVPQDDVLEAQEKVMNGGDTVELQKAVSFSSVRKRSEKEVTPELIEKRTEIKKLLIAMSPPDPSSVDKLIEQYDGKENELLTQLRELVESQPFDEPIKTSGSFASSEMSPLYDDSDERRDLADGLRIRTSSSMNSRVRTANTSWTGYSSKTDRTQKISNTNTGSVFESIAEGVVSAATSFSDHSDDEKHIAKKSVEKKEQVPGPPVARTKKQEAPRIRELRVEEFTSNRYGLTTEKFNGNAALRGERRVTPQNPGTPLTTPTENENDSVYNGDNDETDVETFATDSVSGLSGSDHEFSHRKQLFEVAMRRTLSDAIKKKDWDTAANLADDMREDGDLSEAGSVHRVNSGFMEWTQSALDKFISENDWDAVAKYIAQMRDSNSEVTERRREKKNVPEARLAAPRTTPHGLKRVDSPQKRFGARSQLQHSELVSDSSCDGSRTSYDSDDYSSASSASSDDDRRYRSSKRRREFVC